MTPHSPESNDTSQALVSPVVLRHYAPNLGDKESLAKQCLEQIQEILDSENPSFLYGNPICTITCEKPTSEFYRLVRGNQSKWCQQATAFMGRGQTRKLKHWDLGRDGNGIPSQNRKYLQFVERGLCFTGLLFVQGRPIPPHQWPKPCGDNSTSTSFKSASWVSSTSSSYAQASISNERGK